MYRSDDLSVFLLVAVMLAAPLAAKDEKEDARGFKEFSERMNRYVSLHKTVEGTLPSLKQTDVPELITAHQQALARKIREARPQAKRGDIFTSEASEAFRHAVAKQWDGAHGRHARATISQGEPLRTRDLPVNDVYPEKLPYTTVPPTMLSVLPKLPQEMAYRIVGRSILLIDVRANLIVDLIREAMPKTFVPTP